MKERPSNKKNEIAQLQNELKESFKKLHLDSKNKTKTINNYSALIATIRKEYEILHKENQQLKIKIEKLEDYNTHQQFVDYNKRVMKKLPKRKRKYHQAVYQSSSSSESDVGNNYYYKQPRGKNKKQKKNKIYYEDVDGYENEYEENVSDEDNDDNDLEEEEIKEKPIPKNPKYLKYKKIKQKGITKLIKMS